MLKKIISTISGSKWNSRKLVVTIITAVPLIFQMFSVSDANQQMIYGFASAMVAAVYAIAQSISESRRNPTPITPAQIDKLVSAIASVYSQETKPSLSKPPL